MRGKRSGSVSYRLSLKPQAPARTSGATSAGSARLRSVARMATSTAATCRIRFTLAAKTSGVLTGAPMSYGMSRMVVTPPAAAARVASSMVSAWLLWQWTWASTIPG